MIRNFCVGVVAFCCLTLVSLGAQAQGEPGELETIITGSGQIAKRGWARHGTAPTIWEIMRDYQPPTMAGFESEVPIRLPDRLKNLPTRPPSGPDPLGKPFLERQAPAAELSFNGYDSDDNVTAVGFRIMPPDTNGDVGLDYYVQYNNLGWEYYDKDTGVLQGGPFPGNSFWSSFGGFCQTNNSGDPIVLFDRFANRWVFSQFTSPNNNDGHQCFAVTTGSDPEGPYNLYDFTVSPGQFNDYPKIGVWTDGGDQSAYHMSTNEFGVGFVGVNVTAFDRDAMLAGTAASFIQFTEPPATGSDPFAFSLQPPNLEGDTSADASTCGRYIQVFDDETWGVGSGPDGYRFWDFCTDFATPNNSTWTGFPFVTTSEFDANLCGYDRNCVPQPSPGNSLDTLGQFTMYRFNNRVIAGNLHGVISHTVDLGGNLAGVRYAMFDLENGNEIDDTGTLAVGDGLHRWMPSVAMDKVGNIGIGYTRSSGSSFPSAYFTGRETDDPAGQLQTESVCINGTGVQQGGNRWGDYAAVSVDPDDECTFYVTNEFVETTGSFEWDNQICAFSFDSCTDPGGGDDYAIGSCSLSGGTVTCDVSEATPGARQKMMRSRVLGSAPVPAGPCVGTITDIGIQPGRQQIIVFGNALADGNGDATFVFTSVPSSACGLNMQAIDNQGDCDVSQVIQLSGPDCN